MMAGIGLVVGGLAAIPLSRLLAGLLFGVQPIDPVTIAVAALLLVAVALAPRGCRRARRRRSIR